MSRRHAIALRRFRQAAAEAFSPIFASFDAAAAMATYCAFADIYFSHDFSPLRLPRRC